jgi:phospholipid/cholesterol/gamma-HCH transport system substrate-binding protein
VIGIRAREALAGLVYLVVIAALIMLSVMVFNKDFSSSVNVSLHTDSIGSELQKGSDVKVRGVLVGRVSKLSTDGDGARIELAIDPSKAKLIPANSAARLLPKTLFGERYVSLIVPNTPSEKTLHSGDVIDQDLSTQSVELEQVFQHLLPVLQAIQPDKLAELLGQLSLGLRDRGTQLGQTFASMADYLKKLDPKVPALTSDLDALASVANTYSDAAPSLLSALNDMTATTQTIYAERQQLTNLFGTVANAANDIDGFVGTNSANLIGLSQDSLPTLQVLSRYSAEFPCLTKALTNFIPIANKALGVGSGQPGAHVTMTVVPSMGKYVADKDTPRFTADSGPRCPYVPTGGLSNTALSTTPASAKAGNVPGATATANNGLGTANSPQENQLIAELVAPTMGIQPSSFPAWGSLLLGPVLRGTVVTLK